MYKPKSCPYCGEMPDEPMHDGYSWVVDCMNDECPAALHCRGEDKESALRAWNTRAVDLHVDKWLQEQNAFTESRGPFWFFDSNEPPSEFDDIDETIFLYARDIHVLSDLIDLLNGETE